MSELTTVEPIETPFFSEAGFRAALDAVIGAASREIRIFDHDLTRMMLDEKHRTEALEQFLAGAISRRLYIVIHDIAHAETLSPRLNTLIRRFPNAVEARESMASHKHIADCFLLADGEHGAIRFHRDHARGKLLLHAADQIRPWWQRFDELWLPASSCLAPTRTGL